MSDPRSKIPRPVCSACGTQASCDCHAEYIPAGEYARRVLARNPEKSNRALAVEAGVGYRTVGRLRADTGGPNDPPGTVVGIDGKSYPATRATKAAPNTDIPYTDIPYKNQPEVQRFMKALLKLSWGQKLYIWQYILPKYHPRGD